MYIHLLVLASSFIVICIIDSFIHKIFASSLCATILGLPSHLSFVGCMNYLYLFRVSYMVLPVLTLTFPTALVGQPYCFLGPVRPPGKTYYRLVAYRGIMFVFYSVLVEFPLLLIFSWIVPGSFSTFHRWLFCHSLLFFLWEPSILAVLQLPSCILNLMVFLWLPFLVLLCTPTPCWVVCLPNASLHYPIFLLLHELSLC